MNITVGQVETLINAADNGVIGLNDKASIPNKKVRYWLSRALDKCRSENKVIIDHRRKLMPEFMEVNPKGDPVLVERKDDAGKPVKDRNGNVVKDFKFLSDEKEREWLEAIKEHREQEITLSIDPIEHTEEDFDMDIVILGIILPFLKTLQQNSEAKAAKPVSKKEPAGE